MTISQVLLVAIFAVLTVFTYFFAPLTKDKEGVQELATSSTESTFDIDIYEEKVFGELSEADRTTYASLKASSIGAPKEKQVNSLKTIAELFNNSSNVGIEALYLMRAAEIENDIDSLEKAGDRLAKAYALKSDNPALAAYLLNKAIEGYEKARELNPEKNDLDVKIATAYLDGTNEVMKGVKILLDVVERDPDNVMANLILGRYGIMSGQYDKAVQRLEKVIQKDSLNVEAMFYLAEAYNGLGKKDQAIELFETCKKLINNPDFAREIDDYITKIKNS